MLRNLKAELYCLKCDRETVHEITYIGEHLKSIRCSECGRTTAIDRKELLKYFTVDVIERIISKPHRITEELRNDLQHCIRTLPTRIITKPFRTIQEIRELFRD